MTQERLPWSQVQCERAADTYKRLITDIYCDDHGVPHVPKGAREKVFALIGDQISRSYTAVYARWAQYGVNFRISQPSQKKIISQAETDAELRRRAADRKDLTSTIFGDPPPGYSALDQKRLGLTTARAGDALSGASHGSKVL